MHYLQTILVTGTVLAVLAFAAPTIPVIPKSHLNATRAGIDIYGPIPTDYTHQEGSMYRFEAGSNASIWVRAQLDITAHPNLRERQYNPAGIGIGMWQTSGWNACTGSGYWWNDVNWDIDYYGALQGAEDSYSWGISYRNLEPWEHLDFSSGENVIPIGTLYPCSQYQYSALPETSIGCYDSSVVINCFRLWVST